MAGSSSSSAPTSPLPFVISILPVLLSPSFVHLPAPYLSHPVHLRHQFLRPSADSPGYLQATNDTVVQVAVEARREKLIAARWGIEVYAAQDGQEGMQAEWNADLKDDEGVRARVRIGGKDPQDQLALLIVWEEVRQDAAPAAMGEEDGEDVEEAGWRYYDLQLPGASGRGEKWYNSYEEALAASNHATSRQSTTNRIDNGNGKQQKPKKTKSKKAKAVDDETGLQGEEGGEQDPNDYWAGCSSSEASSSSGGEVEQEETEEEAARREDVYWASYGDSDKKGSLVEDQEQEAQTTGLKKANEQAESGSSASEHIPKTAFAHQLGPANPGLFTAQKRNVSFLQEPGASSTRAVTPELVEEQQPPSIPSEATKPIPSSSSLLGQSLQKNANTVPPSAIAHTSAFTEEKRNISFMNEHNSGFGSSYNEDYDYDYDNDDAGGGGGGGYNYRGFYDYPNVSYPASSGAVSPRPVANDRLAVIQQQNGISSLSSSPTKAVMSSVSSKLQAGHFRDEAVRNAIKGIWDLYKASAGGAVPAKKKDSRIEQYEFMELIRGVVEGDEQE